ncbi:hypothetical protein [uncultured Polaribacter sp.]|uniref:hypothetical protein n=1 Tax=uncultured Polaribacter sp. TaxID=174711 RepID=UPI0026259B54|nr:hypothetical protein [uncultured Polaribacter sp.]
MKTRNLIIALSLLMFTSCVVKSLNPFYTKETISFDENFIGEWEDSKKGNWKVIKFENVFLSNAKKNWEPKFVNGYLDNKVEISKKNLSKEDKKLYAVYKDSYYILRENKNKKVAFIATPFKINNQTFLDFIPIDIQDNIDNLLESHTIYTHSLVKYDLRNNGEIEVRWLDEDKVEALFKEKKIKIKHEKIGIIDDKYLLTAKPEELQRFIKKYMASNDSEKWETSTKFTLSRLNGTD